MAPSSTIVGRHFRKKKRQVVIEIYGTAETTLNESTATPNLQEEAVKTTAVVDLCHDLRDDDMILVRILKPRRGRWGFHSTKEEEDDDDDDSSSSEDEKEDSKSSNSSSNWIQQALSTDSKQAATSPSNLWKQRQEDDWIEQDRFNLEAISFNGWNCHPVV